MTRLTIRHPDPFIRQALGRTIHAVWPDVTLSEQEADLYLIAKPDPALPVHTVILLDKKPLRLRDLIQKLQAARQNLSWPKQIDLKECTLDTLSRRFTKANGESCDLTEKEIAVIVYLFKRKTPATREDLLRDVWGYAADADTHTIETHIYRLRQKIEAQPEQPKVLLTVKDGYQLAASSSA